MSTQSSIQAAGDAVRRLWEKHGIKSPLRLLGFCLSLLPIPVIQQAGATLDRLLSDKDLSEELARLWAQIEGVNAAVAKVETVEAAIAEIAQTVSDNKPLLAACEHLSSTLAGTASEFTVDTRDHSYQQIVNSVVQASRVFISATNRSTNVIENTRVESPRTHLHASGDSRNFVDGTTFSDRTGNVEMRGMSTQGNIFVSGSSVGFGAGGALIFGGNPNEVSGVCPICSTRVTVDKRRLVGYANVQCPGCKNALPFRVG